MQEENKDDQSITDKEVVSLAGPIARFFIGVLTQVQKQGVLICFLTAGIILLGIQIKRLDEKVDACNASIIQIYRDERIEFLKKIEDNTKALERNNVVIENNSDVIDMVRQTVKIYKIE